MSRLWCARGAWIGRSHELTVIAYFLRDAFWVRNLRFDTEELNVLRANDKGEANCRFKADLHFASDFLIFWK